MYPSLQPFSSEASVLPFARRGRVATTGGRPDQAVRTAILLPPGCRFSASRPNSMETVVRTLAGATGTAHIRIFCDEGADDHGLSNVETLPVGPKRLSVLKARLQAFRPEIVEHHQQVKQAVGIAAALPKVRHVLYRHNALKAPQNWIDRLRYNARYSRMDGLIFVSEAEQRAFAHVYPALADRAWAVPNPIDARLWAAAPEIREPVIAFAGRAMAAKGLSEICAALPQVLQAHPTWRAVLLLNDWEQHRAWAEPHVAPLSVFGDRVEVLHSAPLSEVRRRLRSAAIALTPSLWSEPFGLAAVEAHAAGAALISSGRGGLREASGPHAHYLVEVTPRTLVTAMDWLITHPLERQAMARAAQQRVMEAHSPGRRARDLLRARRQILAGASSPVAF
ncbi:glycosyltransferase family 4 protein [Brevundimonas sp.]|jgi:glycosyltransferase involved in cell wall biosynthesis|uniref:glycosyltransferase family 4 protein n=1 Tax=Brevundimonas sp. TaxID=1871086 RepID=UPI0037C02FD5